MNTPFLKKKSGYAIVCIFVKLVQVFITSIYLSNIFNIRYIYFYILFLMVTCF